MEAALAIMDLDTAEHFYNSLVDRWGDGVLPLDDLDESSTVLQRSQSAAELRGDREAVAPLQKFSTWRSGGANKGSARQDVRNVRFGDGEDAGETNHNSTGVSAINNGTASTNSYRH